MAPPSVAAMARAGALATLALSRPAPAVAQTVWRGPDTPAGQPKWLRGIKEERNQTLRDLNWKGGVFDVPELKWTQTAYIQPQMHPYDRFFYDEQTGNYTVQRYLKDLRDRYGGIDALLMWPTYTNIGVDDRNQFDFFRAMPGGLDAVARVTKELHDSGVHVLWPYNPWDSGTRREDGGRSDADTFAELLKQTGGDGTNCDTMDNCPKDFWQAAQRVGHPIAFQPEGGCDGCQNDKALQWSTMGWGESLFDDGYPQVQAVDRQKFITSGKFMTNICERGAKTKTDFLQYAWFNGCGFESWENVWGSWNGITPRDGEAIRRVATMLRYFGKEGHLLSPEWEPHAQGVLQDRVYASKWPLAGDILWTIVNRAGKDLNTPQLSAQGTSKYYDCYHGVELAPQNGALSFPLEKDGYGCVLQTAKAGASLSQLLTEMKGMTAQPLKSYDSQWTYLKQTAVSIAPTKKATSAPNGTVYVKKATYTFEVRGVEIEDSAGCDVQYPWEQHPRTGHDGHAVTVGPFYIDKYPVTGADYEAYLAATGFRPSDPYRWLENWGGGRICPTALRDVPVTYVSLKEARAYCAWAHGGARLPHEWEWQYAAQGGDGRAYPWGDDDDTSRRPHRKSGGTIPGAEPVTAHAPAGDSPFGVSDLVGNVWQYTDEYRDDHTRAVVLRGGSNYRPESSDWYFPQALALDTHGKYFLFDDRYERAGTIGFRCVVDADGEAPPPSPPGPTPSPAPAAWVRHKGKNCYSDHGATDLEHPQGSDCGTMTIAACEAKCRDLTGCTAVTVDTSGGTGGEHQCYRRADVVLSECDGDDGYDTYTQSSPAPPPPPPQCTVVADTDTQRDEYKSAPASDAGACCALCEADSPCRFAAYVPPDQPYGGICYLKSTKNPTRLSKQGVMLIIPPARV